MMDSFDSHRLFILWVARLWIWCYGAVDRIAEMKINTGIYIFCSPAWLASSKCISDLNLNKRDQPLPALHSIRCQEIHCCHKENMYIPNIETYFIKGKLYVKYKLHFFEYFFSNSEY